MNICFLVNIDWFFFSHRFRLYEAIQSKYKTSLICGYSGYKSDLEIKYFESKGRIPTFKGVSQLKLLISTISSDTVFIVVSPVMIFIFQFIFWKRKNAVYNFSGLGVLRKLPRFLLIIILKIFFLRIPRGKRIIVVQNSDDFILFKNVINKLETYYSCELIPGSGFTAEHNTYVAEFSKFTVGYVGRLRKDKGVLNLIRAFNKFKKAIGSRNCELKIWGELDDSNRHGFNKEELNELNKNSEYLQGHVTSKMKIYSSFEFFCLPSNGEGLSKAAIEASAFRKILLLSDVHGNRDMIDNNGLLFKYGSTSNLLKCLNEAFLLNKEQKFSMSEKSFYLFKSRWETHRILNLWFKLLKKYDEK